MMEQIEIYSIMWIINIIYKMYDLFIIIKYGFEYDTGFCKYENTYNIISFSKH